MNLQPSKLSLAANQVWNESTSLFSKKKDVQIDLGLEKALGGSNSNSSQEKTSSSIAFGYVFGSRVAERVTKSGTNCSATSNQENFKDVSSIFKRISEKTCDSKDNMWKSPSSLETNNTTKKINGSDTTCNLTSDRLKASIDEMEKKNKPGSELNSVEPVTTGEEDEWTLLNISCKFFYYNAKSKNWIERGMGTFRINKKKNVFGGVQDYIRILGRTTGSQKVIINSKIFPGMIHENISEKRVKISAQNPDFKLPQLFIIQSSMMAIFELETMLQKFIEEIDAQFIKSVQENSLDKSDSFNRKRKPTETESSKADYENKKFATGKSPYIPGAEDSDDEEEEAEQQDEDSCKPRKRMVSAYPKKEKDTTSNSLNEEVPSAKNDDW